MSFSLHLCRVYPFREGSVKLLVGVAAALAPRRAQKLGGYARADLAVRFGTGMEESVRKLLADKLPGPFVLRPGVGQWSLFADPPSESGNSG